MYGFNSATASVAGQTLEPVEDVAITAPKFDVSFSLTAAAAARVPDVPLGSVMKLVVSEEGRGVLRAQPTILAAREPREDGSVFFGLNYAD